MKEIPLNFVRELTLSVEGKSQKIFLKINRLYFDEQKQKWRCDWSLDVLYPEAVHFAGDDPLQALTSTLDFASSFIRGTITDGPQISWSYDGDMGGLIFHQSESGKWREELKDRATPSSESNETPGR